MELQEEAVEWGCKPCIDYHHTLPNWNDIQSLGFPGLLERAKVRKAELLQNYSFQAGAGVEYSESFSYTTSETSTFTLGIGVDFASKIGCDVSGKGFFIDVAQGGSATLNGTLSDFITATDKEKAPRFVAPVAANGAGSEFDLGKSGVIKNNLVGYIADESKAYTNGFCKIYWI